MVRRQITTNSVAYHKGSLSFLTTLEVAHAVLCWLDLVGLTCSWDSFYLQLGLPGKSRKGPAMCTGRGWGAQEGGGGNIRAHGDSVS